MFNFNTYLNKYFPIFVPIFLVGGILLGSRITDLEFLVPWIFAGATFIGSLKMDFQALGKTLKHPKPLGLALLILRVLMPLWALGLGMLFFPHDLLTRTGLLLFALIPVGINTVIWTVLYRGSVSLSLSVVLIDTVISPFVLPFSVLFLMGTRVNLDAGGMMVSLLEMIVIPSILGMLVNQFSKGEIPRKWSPRLTPLSRLGLLAVILINGASVSDYFRRVDIKLVEIMAAIFFLALSGYVMAWFLARLLRFGREDTITTVFSGGMRNISTGIVIAVAYFPAAAAIPVITGILFQQLICSLFAHFMDSYFEKKTLSHTN